MTLPLSTIVICFDDDSQNTCAKMPLETEHAKRLSKRIFRKAMTALAAEEKRKEILLQVFTETTSLPLDNNTPTC